MSTNSQPEWPKSFRWHTAYCNEPDIVTFDREDEIVTDYCGCIWSYSDCISCNAWAPTDQHKQKSPSAPSQDDVKAARLEGAIKSIRFCEGDIEMCRRENGDIEYLCRAVQFLADAVERLAK